MRFGRKQDREKLKRQRKAAEIVGLAWHGLEKDAQAKVLDIVLDESDADSEYRADIVMIADDLLIPCTSKVMTDLRPKIAIARKSGAEAAERAAAARQKKAYLRRCAAEYDNNKH